MSLLQNKPSGHYIQGQWTTPTDLIFNSINPANGEIIWHGASASKQDVKSAYTHAQYALRSWSQLSYRARAHYLTQFAKQVELQKQDLTQLISLETGKPLWEALTEVNAVINKIDLSIKAYEERCPTITTQAPDSTSAIRYKPHGVVAVLGAYNFPAHLSNGHIVPALLAGNTVIYKPSELTPAVAELIMTCWHHAGIPAGVLQCIQGGVETAKHLLQCDLQGVFFTGSYQTGVSIHHQFATRPEVIVALEMGGNNPLIIDKEINNIEAAVYQGVISSMITAGQRCTCVRRLIIPYGKTGDTFLTQFLNTCQTLQIGAFTQKPEPFMGPVIRYEHALHHLAKQKDLMETGGEILLNMQLLKENTGFLSPGIIDMTNAKNIKDEEIFAPLVQIYRYHELDEAIHLANRTQYGLVAGLFSDNPIHYQKFYDSIRAGIINWNKPTIGASSALPFGGIGKSGNHRPSGYFAADYSAYPIASLESPSLKMPDTKLPGII